MGDGYGTLPPISITDLTRQTIHEVARIQAAHWDVIDVLPVEPKSGPSRRPSLCIPREGTQRLTNSLRIVQTTRPLPLRSPISRVCARSRAPPWGSNAHASRASVPQTSSPRSAAKSCTRSSVSCRCRSRTQTSSWPSTTWSTSRTAPYASLVHLEGTVLTSRRLCSTSRDIFTASTMVLFLHDL
jgi:hypothetical protein